MFLSNLTAWILTHWGTSILVLGSSWICFRLIQIRKETIKSERLAVQRAAEAAAKDRQRVIENERRDNARRQWLAQHRPRLYFNTSNGITAVLRPSDYEENHRRTRNARLNGF